MKKLAIILNSVLLISSFTAFAQEELPPAKREQLESLKAAYLTRELNLTPEEAQQFWPVYNQLSENMHQIREARRNHRRSTRQNHAEMTDTELANAIDTEFDFEQQELNLKKKYNEKFKQLLPIRKVAKLHVAEKEFRRELLRGARDKRRPPGGPPH